MQLELLSPAKNLEQGREAINHGADAVYIGAPAFGARVGATNSLQDIEKLVQYAHLFHCKVFVTINTLLFDDEIEPAVKLIHQLYNIGVDALIVQDMGLLECDLPPIELHASTQTHNADARRVQFLEEAGFKRVILARETSLETMRDIRSKTIVDLEAFVQGALCVCYSGQCYLSEYINHRSGNRGCCSQPCRSQYNLLNEQGQVLRRAEHLLSLKDFNASQHIASMIDAGITSFKIEGRLKDMTYVKNVTAYYRQLLDNYLQGNTQHQPASEGRCTFYFSPDLEKSFNRGFTDYFLEKRQPMATHTTQKAIGKCVGTVKSVERNAIIVQSNESFTAGDGVCYNTPRGMEGFLVNHVEGKRLIMNKIVHIEAGTTLYRNNDYAFEKQMQGKTASRKIAIDITFEETEKGFLLQLNTEGGTNAHATVETAKEGAKNAEKARSTIHDQLTKLGDTIFCVRRYSDNTTLPYFLPSSTLNALRRDAVSALEAKLQQEHYHENEQMHTPGFAYTSQYLDNKLDYSYNVVNKKSEQFYRSRGANEIEHGIDETKDYDNKALMTTKYCLRFELGQCLRCKNNKTIDEPYRGKLYLENNSNMFRLEFECDKCQMKIYKR